MSVQERRKTMLMQFGQIKRLNQKNAWGAVLTKLVPVSELDGVYSITTIYV